jgi:hypothetical protein
MSHSLWPWPINQHGHPTFSIIGSSRSGAEELALFEKRQWRVSEHTTECFKSTRVDGYDSAHRLISQQTYQVAFIPGSEIQNERERTDAAICRRAREYGYELPIAGLVPRVAEVVSATCLEEIGWWYIAALHQSINNAKNLPFIFGISHDPTRPVTSFWQVVDSWAVQGAFMFIEP